MATEEKAFELTKSEASNLIVPVHDFFRVVLLPSRGSTMAGVLCVECEAMVGYKDSGVFACATCDVELYRDEMDVLLTDGIEALTSLKKRVGAIGQPKEKVREWGWRSFLRRMKAKVLSIFFRRTGAR